MYIFKQDLKPRNELQSVFKSKGRLFQTRGSATEKRRLPNIDLQLGAVNSSCDDECRQRCGLCGL